MGKKKFLITTAIDYTNDVIHLGHAYQKIVADVLARYYRAAGKSVYFVTGTDEHGQNIEKTAVRHDRTPREWCDETAAKDKEQLDALDISYDRFLRTTDKDHEETSLWFYQKVLENGDLYEGEYNGYYCESCEAYKTLSELKDGLCEFHPTLEPKRIKEKNYFFRWSKYATFLKSFISTHPRFILPEARRNEMLSFLERGLEDIPVTRQNIRWGFKAPNDPTQTLYVWFDALINYYTAARAPGFWDEETEIIHVLGKDNTRWHTLLWPAMLSSANLRLPDTTLNHGFLTLNGKKISKTLGNIIRPVELTRKYGVDAVRYYLLRHGPLFDDANISAKKLEEIYKSDLANGLGNLVSRMAKLCEPFDLTEFTGESDRPGKGTGLNLIKPYFDPDSRFYLRIDLALELIWQHIKSLDGWLSRERPWEKSGDERKRTLGRIFLGGPEIPSIREIAEAVTPFLPDAGGKIKSRFSGPKVLTAEPLFPKL